MQEQQQECSFLEWFKQQKKKKKKKKKKSHPNRTLLRQYGPIHTKQAELNPFKTSHFMSWLATKFSYQLFLTF